MKINKLLTILLLTNSTAIYAGLNDTGITTCSNATQNGLPCPVAGFPGQDAEYGANSFDFTKLDANGNAISVAATNHSCVKDNVTGLMWEVKTDDGGLRDKDNTYTFDQAATFATQVNATNLCGHNDWRLPEPHELASIVDYAVSSPSIDEVYFPNTQSSYYWTNSPDLYDVSTYSWIVDFDYGYVSSYNRYGGLFVRCVRMGQLPFSFSFTDQGDGTIKDNNTNLVWAKCSLGQTFVNGSCSGSATGLTWQQALQAADGLTLAGHSDWRLPNVKELQSIADYTKYNPAISSTYFPNTPNSWFWTSSPYKDCAICSWIVAFANGRVGDGYSDGGNFVRCVRVGQWLFSFSLSINKLGAGLGTITSNPAGINCGAVCAANFAQNSSVTLTAAPNTGSVFAGWGGDADCNDGTVTMNADKNCTATFNLNITAPTATTGTATNITPTSATLNGTVISSGDTATVRFDIGTTAGVYTTVNIPATPSSVYSSTAVAVSANKTGLTCNTTYHYRVKATNSAGTNLGTNQSFTTTTCLPQPINGVCGSDNGGTFPTAPTTNLCSTGTATAVTGTGPWNWNCTGTNGGSTASCSANISVTSYTVTASANPVAGNVAGSFIPETPQNVTAGTTTSFTVTPNEGYTTNSAVTGTCPPGSWNDKVWTTGSITANCTVIFGFTAVTSWISPPNQTVIPSQNFTLDITIKSTSVKVGQYTFVVTFDPNKLRLDTTYTDGTGLCINGVCPGINALANRFIPVINNDTITLNGNDPIGTGPGNDLQLLIIHFKSRFIYDAPSFTTNVTLHTNLLTTTDGDNIGTGARGATVNVSTGLCGDATGDTLVNIVDALGIARKIVGMPPPPTVDIVLADVNEDGRVAITDALHIARYSVGLVTPPEVCTIGEAF